ncbi:hypothetical protein H0H81_005878 [Sphagnurus paluster]|uniref:GPI inositol-deacylase n=1 Tax=Sphagnurus paluster TaxID=117069 RepID=A0A9P7FYN4_9AGAR|nr:hypothetical protein H0H81_005878 [Sphagnurus paluster]
MGPPAVEFNEDLSAFHGPTIGSQIIYTSHAISYILSLYPANTSIIIMGHSMGGIVATALLPNPQISAIITMSTPHILPPARFDSRIDKIYNKNRETIASDTTPILSLCGGATDMMVPSESCILPAETNTTTFRRTVFTSALEGAWTGVGHREMVWCHQVRARVARAALELGASRSLFDKRNILDKWLRDGHTLPPVDPRHKQGFTLTNPETYEYVEEAHLKLMRFQGLRTFLLPLPSAQSLAETPLKAVLLVGGGGIIPPISPQKSGSLQGSLYMCATSEVDEGDDPRCVPLEPTLHRLIPNPHPRTKFPAPNEGASEYEGAALFEADIPIDNNSTDGKNWLAVRVEGGDRQGWVVGGLSVREKIIEAPSTYCE